MSPDDETDDLKPKERFHGLPDDVKEQERVLGIVRKLDPDARLHRSCSAPLGTLLEVHTVPAAVLAQTIIDGYIRNHFSTKR